MVTCKGPRCSGESCREADWIPWLAIHVTLVPSSSVHALEPTGELTVITVGSAFACDPIADPAVSWAAVSAAAAAVAVAGGVAGAVEPAVAVEVAAFGSVARLWPSRVSSTLAVLVLVPVPVPTLLPCDEAPLADTVDVADVPDGVEAVPLVGVGIAATAPANAPLNAFSRSVRAVDTGSAPECLPDGSVADLLLPLAGAALVAAVPSAGVAASDWASALEKSSLAVPDCAVVCAEDAEDAPAAGAVARPARELLPALPD